MSICRACGIEIGKRDDFVVVADARMHVGCVEVSKEPKKRQIGMWAAMGSRGQMAMGDVQRDTPIN